MRGHLDRILDGLPCGVLVAKSDGAISLINPEGRRLLGSAQTTKRVDSFGSLWSVPEELRDLLQRARSEPGEQERLFADGCGGERGLAVRHAAVADAGLDADDNGGAASDAANCVSMFILRDVSDATRLVEERELGRAFRKLNSRRLGKSAASICPPHSRWTAPPCRRAGGPRQSSAALFLPGALPPEAPA